MYVQVHDARLELGRSFRRGAFVAASVLLFGLVAVFAFTQAWHAREFRRACDAHGGIVLEGVTGRVCVWAGAIIPIEVRP